MKVREYQLHKFISFIEGGSIIVPEKTSSLTLVNYAKAGIQIPIIYGYENHEGIIVIINENGIHNLIEYYEELGMYRLRIAGNVKIIVNVLEGANNEEIENYINIVNS